MANSSEIDKETVPGLLEILLQGFLQEIIASFFRILSYMCADKMISLLTRLRIALCGKYLPKLLRNNSLFIDKNTLEKTLDDIIVSDQLKIEFRKIMKLMSLVKKLEDEIKNGYLPSDEIGNRRATIIKLKENLRFQSGIVLYGPPGTGKTELARAIVGEASKCYGFSPMKISSTDIIDPFIGGSSKNAKTLFQDIMKESEITPVIIFIDEIDTICSNRTKGSSHNRNVNDEVDVLKGNMLQYIENTLSTGKIIIIGTTNRYDELDEAFVRPGRLGNYLNCDYSDEQSKKMMLKSILQDIKCKEDVSLEEVYKIVENHEEISFASMKAWKERIKFRLWNIESDKLVVREASMDDFYASARARSSMNDFGEVSLI